MEIGLAIFFVGLLVFLAHLFSTVFDKTRIPDVLPLVFLGLLIGPIFRWVRPEVFGELGIIFTTIALVVILFQSGLDLHFSALKESAGAAGRLAGISFAVTLLIVAGIGGFFLWLPLLEALALGAIVTATSAAVVIPLVQKLRIQGNTKTILLLEATFTDVLCILGSLALIEAIRFQMLRPGLVVGQIIASFLLAAAIGGISGIFWAFILHRVRRLENSIFTTPAFVLMVFGVAELLGYSGAIAALVFGITLGNVESISLPFLKRLGEMHHINLSQVEKSVFSEAVFLLKTFFFVYIGISIRLDHFILMFVGLVITSVLFAIRLPIVRMTISSAMTQLDATIMSVMVPRGLVSAVMASLLIHSGAEKGAVIQDVAYSVILLSIVMTTMLTFLIEKGFLRQPYATVFRGYASNNTVES